MNFFFGINYKNFKTELQIPLFKNSDKFIKKINLYKCFIKNDQWNYKVLNFKKKFDSFYLIDSDEINNNDIFFLADKEDEKKFNQNSLMDYNSFTNSFPEYRANLKLKLINGGFSSYQSEYPYEMTKKRGSILSSINNLVNKNAEQNYICIKNIFFEPINEQFKGFLINYKNKKVIEEFDLLTNKTNIIELKGSQINDETYLFTDKFLGIPLYISCHNGHISFEHTHPPHEYILSQNRFEKVAELKKKFHEIIN